VRRIFTNDEANEAGVTAAALRWGERHGRWRRIDRCVWGEGPEDPSPVDRAVASVLATRGVASGCFSAAMHELDGIAFCGPDISVPPSGNARRVGVRRRNIPDDRIVAVGGVPCTDGLQTLLDLAPIVDDLVWEQALESALRKRLVTLADLEANYVGCRGAARIRRVLGLRPRGAPATESLLETLMVQLMRTVPGLPPFERQYRVFDCNGLFVARVDFANADLGAFLELDGEHHKGQPVYDANRETAVVAATAWLCGRFTWTEVTRVPRTTGRRLLAIAERARQRPLA
jgi:very-short-patch-repair endonuclease